MTSIPALQEHIWPFDVPPPEKCTYHDERAIEFLEAAHELGYKAYMYGPGNLGAQSDQTGRGGIIFVRGRHRREVAIGTSEETAASIFTSEFDAAARAVLDWITGTKAEIIENRLGSQIVTPQTRAATA